MSSRIVEEYKPIINVIQESGMAPDLPPNLEPAIKFTNPDWTTRDGFSWFQPGRRWIISPDNTFDPQTCVKGGLHVASTISAAQSGGAMPTYALWVGVKPSESGPWEDGKRKAKRVYVAGPLDLLQIINHGRGANLARADLRGANLWGANLWGANLARADLWGANLWEAYLEGAYLARANLRGAYLARADLRGAVGRDDWDDLVARGAIR